MRHVAPHVGSLTVLTATHNRPLIEGGPSLPAGVVVEYVPAPALPGQLGHRISYAIWLARALRRARELHAREPFDLVHHVTYNMSWIPPLPGRLGIPFVRNAGAVVGMPLAFVSARNVRGSVSEFFRNLVIRAGWRISEWVTPADLVILGGGGDARCRRMYMGALEREEVPGIPSGMGTGPASGL